MTVGFVVGKFYPPHRGHKHLIDSARLQVDKLIVMIAHHPTHTISGQLRKAWLEEIHPDCEIHLVADELEDDSQQWAEFTLAYLKRAPDVVFSSEDYGPEFARIMGAKHVMVDPARQTFSVSGTMVRADVLKHLDLLEPCVRAYFVRRVVLIGAESTGKTTLAKQLAEHFATNWVPEYGREHWEQKVSGLTLNDPLPSWSSDEFLEIATEQQRREQKLAGTANRVLICDTNAFATSTWHERYKNSRDERVDAVGTNDKVDLYLLTAPDIPFVQDGFRDGESIREWMHRRFMQQLVGGQTPWLEIHGTFADRFAKASIAVEDLLKLPVAR